MSISQVVLGFFSAGINKELDRMMSYFTEDTVNIQTNILTGSQDIYTNRNEIRGLQKKIDKQNKLLLEYKNDDDYKEATDGFCVFCLVEQGVYAMSTCGCMCYCKKCKEYIQDEKVIQSWKCPLCNLISPKVIRIYNLPDCTA